jgi:alpha-L-fucosidase
LLPLAFAQGGLVVDPKNVDRNERGDIVQSLPIDLEPLVNNRAFAMSPGDADYDGIHGGYPAQYLPDANFTLAGTNYIFPQYKPTGHDNVLAQGQVITPPKGRYFSINMLVAAERAVATGSINVTYTDNSTSSSPVLVDPFWEWFVCPPIEPSLPF